MLDSMVIFYNRVIKRVSFWLPLVVLTLVGYGFSAFNPTVGIDDLARDIYIGDGNAMLSATRWGMNVWIKLFSTFEFVPGVDHLIGIFFMLCASLAYSFLFYSLSSSKDYSLKYTVFACLFITYPLINEIWEYSGANFMVAGNMFIVALVLSYMEYHKHLEWKTVLFCGVPLSLVAASYETGIFVYITSVLLILFYKFCFQNKEQRKYEWFLDGASYIPALAVSIIIRIVVGVSIIKLLGLTYKVNGDASVVFDLLGFLYNGILYVFNSIVYLPITVFLFFLVLLFIYSIILSKKNKASLPLILFILIGISLFAQAILTLSEMPYRTAHTLIIFVSFFGLLVMELVEAKLNKKIVLIVFCLLMYIAYQQGLFLDSLLTLNHLRSENEASIVTLLGYQIESQYDDKPVIFVGDYSIGEYFDNFTNVGYEKLNHKLYRIARNFKNPQEKYKYIDTNINSNLSWSIRAFDSQNMMMAYFSYFGFDIELIDCFSADLYDQVLDKAREYGMKPYEIKDEGEYLIVCLGSLEWGFDW